MTDMHAFINLEFVLNTFSVSFQEAEINLGLTEFLESKYIGNKRYVEVHVAVEHESAGRIVAQGRIRSATGSMHGSSKCTLDNLGGIIFFRGRIKRQLCAYNLTDGLVHSLDDGIRGSIVGGDRSGLDTSIRETKLEGVVGKFGATIVDTAEGTGVTGKVGDIKRMPSFIAILSSDLLDFK